MTAASAPDPRRGDRSRSLAVCIGRYEYGGQGTVVLEELCHLRDSFDITLITEEATRELPSGIAVQIMAPLQASHPHRPNPAVVDFLRSFDVIHCHDSLGFMWAARASGQRLVVTSHGIAPIRLRTTPRNKLEAAFTLVTYPLLYRSAHAVVAISEYVGKWIWRHARVRAQVILNGTSSVLPELPNRPSTRSLLYVGEVSSRKGIDDLLSGFTECPDDVTLKIVGRGDMARVCREIAIRRLASRVSFCGEVSREELAALRRSAFATVTASRWEGFCLPIIEGFASGSPAIARAQGGMQELISRSGAGVTFTDSRELAACVYAIDRSWELFSARAIEFASKHTWARQFDAYSAALVGTN